MQANNLSKWKIKTGHVDVKTMKLNLDAIDGGLGSLWDSIHKKK